MSIVLQHHCAHCTRPIVDGQYWCREKVFGSDKDGVAPAYRYYHATAFAGEELSCHDKMLLAKVNERLGMLGGRREAN